jgi:hypothetical protein
LPKNQGEEGADDKKRGSVVGAAAPPATKAPGRPYLLRRGTNAGNAGSFKRRSLKLRRNTKDAASSKSENESTDCKLSFYKTIALHI